MYPFDAAKYFPKYEVVGTRHVIVGTPDSCGKLKAMVFESEYSKMLQLLLLVSIRSFDF